MVFSCFCSNKKFMKENVISPDKFVMTNKTVKMLNPLTNTVLNEKEFDEKIVTTSTCNFDGRKYFLVCIQKKMFILDDNFFVMYYEQFDDEILCSSSEIYKPHFYIGFKSGRISVSSIRILNTKFIYHEIHNYYCFKPVYSIAIHIEKINGEMKRNVFAGFSRWNTEGALSAPSARGYRPLASQSPRLAITRIESEF